MFVANKIGAVDFALEDQRAVEALTSQVALALQQGFLQASIGAQRAQTQALLDSMPSGVMFIDAETRQVTANPHAMKLLGVTISPDAGIDQYLDVITFPDGRPVPIEALPSVRALAGEESPREHFVFVHRDGKKVPVVSTAAQVRGFGQKLLGAVVAIEDVSGERDLERFRNLERVRQEFNATVAHDLRNPIQTVLAQIHLLLRKAEGDEVRAPVEALRRIERSTALLSRMASVLLQVSRLELNRVQLRREPRYLPDVVTTVVERMRPGLADEGHVVEVSVEGRPPAVSVDELAFELILTNLVDNAAKFSPKDLPIRVSVRASEDGVLVSVEDRGPGISRDAQAQLFDRFRQAAGAEKMKTGLGLGLFVVKGYVDAHGGRLTVDSELGRGSTFHVWLPALNPPTSGTRPPA
jgi:PAS domain S-box-containing protein